MALPHQAPRRTLAARNFMGDRIGCWASPPIPWARSREGVCRRPLRGYADHLLLSSRWVPPCPWPSSRLRTVRCPLARRLPRTRPGNRGPSRPHPWFRVICSADGTGGSGFLHGSGKVISAAHVVAGCDPSKLVLIPTSGSRVPVSDIKLDEKLDLALLTPQQRIGGVSFPISSRSSLTVGATVTTWGYPAGYSGAAPLLSVGYLAGEDRVKTAIGLSPPRWVVNAAINGQLRWSARGCRGWNSDWRRVEQAGTDTFLDRKRSRGTKDSTIGHYLHEAESGRYERECVRGAGRGRGAPLPSQPNPAGRRPRGQVGRHSKLLEGQWDRAVTASKRIEHERAPRLTRRFSGPGFALLAAEAQQPRNPGHSSGEGSTDAHLVEVSRSRPSPGGGRPH